MQGFTYYLCIISFMTMTSLGADNVNVDESHINYGEFCRQKYRNMTFVPKEKHQGLDPPLLWTFPGSGSGWTRLIIEHATGHLSGTVYGDESLLSEFPGEYFCGPIVSVIKAHPTTHDFSKIAQNRLNHRCTVKNITKAIMIIRNPFDAIFSDYNRLITRSHVGKIKKVDFNRTTWEANAKRYALLYKDMWRLSYEPFMQRYPQGYVLVRYEDLFNKELRIGLLAKIMDIMGYEYTGERLQCAFNLANHPKVHRPVIAAAAVVTEEEAYTRPLVCDVLWPILKNVAMANGYGAYGGMIC